MQKHVILIFHQPCAQVLSSTRRHGVKSLSTRLIFHPQISRSVNNPLLFYMQIANIVTSRSVNNPLLFDMQITQIVASRSVNNDLSKSIMILKQKVRTYTLLAQR